MTRSITNSRYGYGPTPCDILIVGSYASFEEINHEPFWHKSKVGKELNRYLWTKLQKLSDAVHKTCVFPKPAATFGKDGPSPDELCAARSWLGERVALVAPAYVAAVGSVAASYFLGDDFNMDAHHGVPHLAGGRVVVPVVDIAAGFTSPEFQSKTAWDWEQFAKAYKPEAGEDIKFAPEDDFPNPIYTELTVQRLRRLDVVLSGAIDTEGSSVRPWGLSFATIPGEATVVRTASARFSVDATFKRRAILHNSLHDLTVLEAMGVELEDGTYDDTMIKAYELGIEPQGLKDLALRHCGMRMSAYEEVMGEANMRVRMDWLTRVDEWLNKQLTDASGEFSVLGERVSLTPKTAGKKSKKTCRKKRG